MLILRIVFVALTFELTATANAQDRQADFNDKPMVVLNTGGHRAPIRKLVFTADESRLLSAGEDKVIHVWNLTVDPPILERTIRPPVWRGNAGSVQALALSTPDAQGQAILAVAGVGVNAMRGEIRLFRFPGRADRPQGDPLGILPAGEDGQTPFLGHTNGVNSLAFSPDGTQLASGSSDGTARLWDIAGHTSKLMSVLGQGRVLSLAFTGKGTRLVTGGFDGTLRVWDVSAAVPGVVSLRPPAPVAGLDIGRGDRQIKSLAISPDGAFVVIGREDGSLERFPLAADGSLGPATVLRRPGLEFNAGVLAIAFVPDGRLATSIVRPRLKSAAAVADYQCDVSLRRMADGAVVLPVALSANTVHALAVSPRGRYIGFGGDDEQYIGLKDLTAAPEQATRWLKGQGRSIWQVGFVKGAEALALAYLYSPLGQVGTPPPARYWGFDLRTRSRNTFDAASVQTSFTTFDAWSVRPLPPDRLAVLNAGQIRFTVTLNLQDDGYWWSWTFIPPGPGHDKPALAVACDRGVAIYGLDGVRTRFLRGHSSFVYSAAPSPDGRWLVTGSLDQTLCLWPLAGCDTLAPLGATFLLQRDGKVVVNDVTKNGFADQGGLLVGDVAEETHLNGSKVLAPDFLRRYAINPPAQWIQLKLRRKAGLPTGPNGVDKAGLVLFGTRKAELPALTFFPGRDDENGLNEWVLWTPRGYYDASIRGDSTLLGWQINRSLDGSKPTEYFPALTYEKELRQPRDKPDNKIDVLLRTGDPNVAAIERREEPAPEAESQPPRITARLGPGGAAPVMADARPLVAGDAVPPMIRVPEGQFALDWLVETWQDLPPGPFEVRVDGEVALPPARPALDPASKQAMVPFRRVLSPGTYRVTALAKSGKGISRAAYIDVEVVPEPKRVPPLPPPREPRAWLLALAPAFSADSTLREIKFSGRDANDLLSFFGQHTLSIDGRRVQPPLLARGAAPLVGHDATAAKFLAALKSLGEAPVEPGDMAVVVVETHVVRHNRVSWLAAADTRALPGEGAVSADTVSATLGSLVRQGCRVVLVLDCVHEAPAGRTLEEKWDTDITEWVKSLYNEHDVITLVASLRHPVPDSSQRNRALAQAILRSVSADRPRSRSGKSDVLSLADFRGAVITEMRRSTQMRAEPDCFIPVAFPAGVPLLSTKPRPAPAPSAEGG